VIDAPMSKPLSVQWKGNYIAKRKNWIFSVYFMKQPFKINLKPKEMINGVFHTSLM
jgi:hypothetical protein